MSIGMEMCVRRIKRGGKSIETQPIFVGIVVVEFKVVAVLRQSDRQSVGLFLCGHCPLTSPSILRKNRSDCVSVSVFFLLLSFYSWLLSFPFNLSS
jgi:hypothetical protein